MSLYPSVIRLAHRAYKLTLSPWIGRQCRFLPTCSDYAAQALILHGPLRGGYLCARRLCRCHPFGGSGYDPVPPRRSIQNAGSATRSMAERKTDDRTDISRRPGP